MTPRKPSSTRTSPLNQQRQISQEQDNMSMFFNFSTPHEEDDQDLSPYQAGIQSSTDSHESVPRTGGIRVSLACIPCRSRHVKCSAEMPSCNRCVQDDKPCFYAKSRRGMRDRNTPRRRAANTSGTDKSVPFSTIQGGHNIYSSSSLSYPGGPPSETYSRSSSVGPRSPVSISSSPKLSGRQVDPRRLLDLYYNFFHKAHPFALPRYSFFARLESDPESLKYLLPVMQYIGSLFAPDVSSSELRDVALKQLDHPNLPPNGFTVIALMLTAIAAHGEDNKTQGRMILDRAIYMALEIQMNSRTFANMERDPVLAESWRRTYWGLYITDATFASITQAQSFSLYTIEANVELPCEECEYDAIIPRPRTLTEYEARDFEDEEQIFSSFTYLIDVSRIAGSLLGLEILRGKEVEAAVASADAMLVNWKLHLPREKQGVVDRNEDVDEMLFQAHNLLQLMMVLIHRPLSRLYPSPIESISLCAPLPPSHELTGQEDRAYWLHTKKCLEAAELAINLYALPIPILQHSPLGVCGVVFSTLANLSACAHSLNGTEWYRTRDRIRLGLGSLKKFSEIWAISRRAERETKKVAKSVFSLPRNGDSMVLHSQEYHPVQTINDRNYDFQMTPDYSPAQLQLGMSAFDNMGIDNLGDMSTVSLDYLSMLENTQSMSRVHG